MGDEDGSFTELANLKKRLESLGVKIRSGLSDETNTIPGSINKDDVNRLLARCTHVEAALNTIGSGGEAQNSTALAPNSRSETPTATSSCQMQLTTSPKRKRCSRNQSRAWVPTVRNSTAVSAGNRSSPLASLLADYKEAESKWNREKAELRRQLSGERKRTSKLEAAQTKLQSLYENRLVDLKALRTALSNREDQLKAACQRQKEQDDLHAANMDKIADELAAMTRERDDVKALLVATLQRLEAVDRVVARADDSNAALERQVSQLAEERNLAVQDASSAKARVEAMKKSQRRVEWQNKMLDKISEVQMAHSRTKTQAMHELLDKTGALKTTDQDSTVADTFDCTEDL